MFQCYNFWTDFPDPVVHCIEDNGKRRKTEYASFQNRGQCNEQTIAHWDARCVGNAQKRIHTCTQTHTHARTCTHAHAHTHSRTHTLTLIFLQRLQTCHTGCGLFILMKRRRMNIQPSTLFTLNTTTCCGFPVEKFALNCDIFTESTTSLTVSSSYCELPSTAIFIHAP